MIISIGGGSMQKKIEDFWNELVAFHGHSCPGLALGCRLAYEAAQKMDIEERSRDEELVCIAETDACGIDAMQQLLGCTLGKGNLLLKLRGKQAFTFYKRGEPNGVRFVWTASKQGTHSKAERIDYYLHGPSDQLYRTQRVDVPAPVEALISPSVPCCVCGELTAEPMMRFQNAQGYCLDCFIDPSRIL